MVERFDDIMCDDGLIVLEVDRDFGYLLEWVLMWEVEEVEEVV